MVFRWWRREGLGPGPGLGRGWAGGGGEASSPLGMDLAWAAAASDRSESLSANLTVAALLPGPVAPPGSERGGGELPTGCSSSPGTRMISGCGPCGQYGRAT